MLFLWRGELWIVDEGSHLDKDLPPPDVRNFSLHIQASPEDMLVTGPSPSPDDFL